MRLIKLSDVKWKKSDTYHMDEDGNEFDSDAKMVEGETHDGIKIGHYITGRLENEVCCCVSFDEENGGNIFINRSYMFDDMSKCTDKFFREKLVAAYNKILSNKSRIREIFD